MSAEFPEERAQVVATALPAVRRPRAAWRPLLALALYLHLLLLGVMSLAWNAVALVLYPLLPRRAGLRVGRAGIAHGYRLYWRIAAATGMLRIDASALDALRDERGLILVSNHPGMMDGLILVSRLPRAACIMKADLMRNVFLGAGARLARYIRNDSAEGLVRCAVEDLKSGGQLVVFPEGTRTVQHPVNPFRPGVTLIAKRAGAPIQTVFIDTDSPYLGKGWPLWRLPPLPIVFRVRLGRRFDPVPGVSVNARLAELQQYVAAHVHPCPLPPSDPASRRAS